MTADAEKAPQFDLGLDLGPVDDDALIQEEAVAEPSLLRRAGRWLAYLAVALVAFVVVLAMVLRSATTPEKIESRAPVTHEVEVMTSESDLGKRAPLSSLSASPRLAASPSAPAPAQTQKTATVQQPTPSVSVAELSRSITEVRQQMADLASSIKTQHDQLTVIKDELATLQNKSQKQSETTANLASELGELRTAVIDINTENARQERIRNQQRLAQEAKQAQARIRATQPRKVRAPTIQPPFAYTGVTQWGRERLANVVYAAQAYVLAKGESLAGWRLMDINADGFGITVENSAGVQSTLTKGR